LKDAENLEMMITKDMQMKKLKLERTKEDV
jgi:hypothetical protein